MLKPTGLVSGHYECRSFAESLPILKEFLALEVIAEDNREKIVKHPNTDWCIVAHENGADSPIKSMRNHYGVRVTSNAEVDRATEYLESRKEQFGIKVIKPRENHNAYSVHFYEPGGNYWEIESYEHAVEHGMGKTTNPHWSKPLSPEKFSGKGYVPQALTHGTLENDDLEASERFYREALGLEVVKLWPSSCYVKHPNTPWYIVCIQTQNPNRPRLSRFQRFTIALESPSAVHDAHRTFTAKRDPWKLRALEDVQKSNDSASFLFADLNGNWWEIGNPKP
jgi:catechol 2,3-dioxygenase-like lactoylglutathione lyase family enzyme